MTVETYTPGGDAKVIADIAKSRFGGFAAMFEHHGWAERGSDMMRKVQSRVVETYGSVRAFDSQFGTPAFPEVKVAPPDCWTDQTSVLFTSLWDWGPEEWGAIGWTGTQGLTRRNNLLETLSNPFICVCYVTSNKTPNDPNVKGMIAGFFLLSHETGDRDEFTHPAHHERNPEKWRHSLRPLRAFSYLPEYRPEAMDMFPELSKNGQPVSKWGQIITDRTKIDELRSIPWQEVSVYGSGAITEPNPQVDKGPSGMVPPGPDNAGGYEVPERTGAMPRELYVLRLVGDTNAFLGSDAQGRVIYKIGLSCSPDLRRQSLQKAMPRGAFHWHVDRTTRLDGHAPYSGHAAAVAGETAMKLHLYRNGDWCGGEFYLATPAEMAKAWDIGRKVALASEKDASSA